MLVCQGRGGGGRRGRMALGKGVSGAEVLELQGAGGSARAGSTGLLGPTPSS